MNKHILIYKNIVDTKKTLFLFSGIVLQLASTALLIYSNFLFARAIDYITIYISLPYELLYQIVIMTFMQLFLGVISAYVLQLTGIHFTNTIRFILIDKILSFSETKFESLSKEDTASILSYDVSSISNIYSNNIPNIIVNFITVFLMAGSLIYINLKLSIVMVVMIVTLVIIYIIISKVLSDLSSDQREKVEKIIEYSYRLVNKSTIIKINNMQLYEKKRGKHLIDELTKVNKNVAKKMAIISPLLNIITTTTLFGLIFYGIYIVSLNELSIGGLVSFYLLFTRLMAPIIDIGKQLSEISGLQGSIDRVFNLFIINVAEERDKKTFPKEIKNITFSNVTFGYTDDKRVINDVTFSVEKGETIAVIGKNGEGKSTLFKLLLGLYADYDGVISVNNIDIKNISSQDLRNHIGYATQSSDFLNETIKENLLYNSRSEEVSSSKIKKALSAANFDEIINKLPLALDTYIGENGNLLSGGQKQRLNLAKVMLYDYDIVLLDEIHSAQDVESSDIILDSIYRYYKDKIVFIISHSYSILESVDKVLYLNKGKVEGFSSHNELLEKNEMYKKTMKNFN